MDRKIRIVQYYSDVKLEDHIIIYYSGNRKTTIDFVTEINEIYTFCYKSFVPLISLNQKYITYVY